jgi:metal-dependent amidase/aminoacylase/carboxypeptidase family protein
VNALSNDTMKQIEDGMRQTEAHVDRNRSLIMGSEDFAYMLEACSGAFTNIGNGDTDGPFHSPRYDFNDAAFPIGASPFAVCWRKNWRDVPAACLLEPGSSANCKSTSLGHSYSVR